MARKSGLYWSPASRSMKVSSQGIPFRLRAIRTRKAAAERQLPYILMPISLTFVWRGPHPTKAPVARDDLVVVHHERGTRGWTTCRASSSAAASLRSMNDLVRVSPNVASLGLLPDGHIAPNERARRGGIRPGPFEPLERPAVIVPAASVRCSLGSLRYSSPYLLGGILHQFCSSAVTSGTAFGRVPRNDPASWLPLAGEAASPWKHNSVCVDCGVGGSRTFGSAARFAHRRRDTVDSPRLRRMPARCRSKRPT